MNRIDTLASPLDNPIAFLVDEIDIVTLSAKQYVSACTTIQPSAPFTVPCPEGRGRDRVRATWASMSRSVMSFQVHPAPRMTKAPMAQASASAYLPGFPAAT